MDYIYLDWNVIQYMKHSRKDKNFNGAEFSSRVKELSKKYIFPFSEGHLVDLANSYCPDNKENIDADLLYLNSLSQGYVLCTIPDTEQFRLLKDVDIHGFFNIIIDKNQAIPTINVFGENHLINMDILPKNDLFRPLLEKSNGVLSPDVMSEFLNNCALARDDPDYYKKFRQQVSEINNRFKGKDTLISTNSDYFKSMMPFLEFIASEKPEDYLSDFSVVMKAFCAINGRCFLKMTEGSKIELTYILLDFHPAFSDKINKKNRPSNVRRDCKNLYYASHAKYYVTQDCSTSKKATFVCKALSLRVEVISMNDFLVKVC